jgi:hypothetical protein
MTYCESYEVVKMTYCDSEHISYSSNGSCKKGCSSEFMYIDVLHSE